MLSLTGTSYFSIGSYSNTFFSEFLCFPLSGVDGTRFGLFSCTLMSLRPRFSEYEDF
jgi:hypothetical protein